MELTWVKTKMKLRRRTAWQTDHYNDIDDRGGKVKRRKARREMGGEGCACTCDSLIALEACISIGEAPCGSWEPSAGFPWLVQHLVWVGPGLLIMRLFDYPSL